MVADQPPLNYISRPDWKGKERVFAHDQCGIAYVRNHLRALSGGFLPLLLRSKSQNPGKVVRGVVAVEYSKPRVLAALLNNRSRPC